MSFRTTSAKKYAKDIGDGFHTVTAANLRKYTPADLRELLIALSIVQREVRAEQVGENDFDAIKKKNWRIQNLSRTILVINTFIKHRRIKMDQV